ncbi:MAG TPA: GNAT family N-acetyltransferase [Pseudonocardia sp.]|uniref:GNAT family N-acetyltransferase n=1 Tax=Pseudonocardia sp. TaxID=60912 RepID=UPI002CF353C1|nr:GNAT family N-acetyltransferase [Pseudonocardia sp.]HTF55476.1 GNAT family N-acetyltransferase [Pseudonocardia sp.]
MSPLVRLARPVDAEAMGRVTVSSYLAAHRGQVPEPVWLARREHWTPEVSARAWADALAEIAADTDPTACVYLAVEPCGEVVGVAMGQPAEASPLPHTGEVSALYVLPGHQGRGLGRRLVSAVATHLRERGLPALTIAVLAANTPARRFYQALGGREVAAEVTEEAGHQLPQVVYGWPDTAHLISGS